jgi:hypothetical protein
VIWHVDSHNALLSGAVCVTYHETRHIHLGLGILDTTEGQGILADMILRLRAICIQTVLQIIPSILRGQDFYIIVILLNIHGVKSVWYSWEDGWLNRNTSHTGQIPVSSRPYPRNRIIFGVQINVYSGNAVKIMSLFKDILILPGCVLV